MLEIPRHLNHRTHRDRQTKPAMEFPHVQLGLGISGQLAGGFWRVHLNPEMNITSHCRREQMWQTSRIGGG